MSARSRDFVRRWVASNAAAPAGAGLDAVAIGALVAACETAAAQAQISLDELEEDGDDLIDQIFASPAAHGIAA